MTSTPRPTKIATRAEQGGAHRDGLNPAHLIEDGRSWLMRRRRLPVWAGSRLARVDEERAPVAGPWTGSPRPFRSMRASRSEDGRQALDAAGTARPSP